MGAVPVLLKLVVAMGVTYGWQPDDRGGVEYIVQISADELTQIQHQGELSTEIDPAVRGHVSRIVLRVGTDKLPRKSPASLVSQSVPAGVRLATSDFTHVPVPTIGDSPASAPMFAPNRTVVAKPANEGPGLKLPQLPGALSDAAAQATLEASKRIDQAGRELAQRGSQQLRDTVSGALRNAGQRGGSQISNPLGTGLLPPPGTRTPTSDPNAKFVRERAGGPSTTSIRSRDASWNTLAGARSGGPSTEPLGTEPLDAGNQGNGNQGADSNRLRGGSLQQQRMPARQAELSRQSEINGVRPRDTFGKMRGGMSFPGANAGTNTTAKQYQPNAEQSRPSSILSQYEQMQLDRQNQQASDTRFQDAAKRAERLAQQKAAAAVRPAADPRLTASEIAAGGWSIDDGGRALDRYGRLLRAAATAGPTVPVGQQISRQTNSALARLNAPTSTSQYPLETNPLGQDTVTQYQREIGQTQFGQPPFNAAMQQTSPTHTQMTTARPTAPAQQPNAYRTQPVRSDVLRSQSTSERDPPSLSNRTTSAASPRPSPKQVAAQPLFNGLLLLSIVANGYLIYWLRNLRLRFRDLVAAKRLASANTPVV